MREDWDGEFEPVVSGSWEVAMDGSCGDLGCGDRAGWAAVFRREGRQVVLAGLVPGRRQTPQRAECWALLRALCGFDGAVRAVTDSDYLLKTARSAYEFYEDHVRDHREVLLWEWNALHDSRRPLESRAAAMPCAHTRRHLARQVGS